MGRPTAGVISEYEYIIIIIITRVLPGFSKIDTRIQIFTQVLPRYEYKVGYNVCTE